MKSLKRLFLLVALALGLNACESIDEQDSLLTVSSRQATVQVSTGELLDVSLTSATVQGVINAFSWSYTEVGIAYTLDKNSDDVTYAKFVDGTPPYRIFSVTLQGLKPDATYYYYTYAKDADGKLIKAAEQKMFCTKGVSVFLDSNNMQHVAMEDATVCWAIADERILTELLDENINADFGVAWSTEEGNLTPMDGHFSTNTKAVTFNQWQKGFALLTPLKPATTYFYVTYVNLGGVLHVSSVKSFVTMAEAAFAGSAPAGVQAIDLGLPSGTKWANMNVGATKVEDIGLFYAWGETVGFHSEVTDGFIFNWINYDWCKGSRESLTKYCNNSRYGDVDNKIILDLADDMAYINWGDNWRMPTIDELSELIDFTQHEWTTVNGVEGCLFKSTSNSNSIFLPAAGCRVSESHYDLGQKCYYWSASIDEDSPFASRYLGYKGDNVIEASLHRYYGMNVRAVLRK